LNCCCHLLLYFAAFFFLLEYMFVYLFMSYLVQDIQIFRGSDIGADHLFVTSRISILSRWKQQSNNSKLANELVYKIYLLQEGSIRRLYQRRLAKNLSEYPRSSTIDKEWENIKMAIKKQPT
jgi:hypothetical protein